MNLNGNTILITGGSVGIGFVLAQALVRRGNRVLICGRRESRLMEAKTLEPALETFTCDVGDPAGRRELFRWATGIAPDLNMLINNAGVQHPIDLLSNAATCDRFEEIAINFEAPVHLSALFIPQLAGRPHAAIVNITSGLAFVPLAFIPVYCATKAAMHSFSMSLRHQLRSTSIKVFEVAPPLVQSELHAHQPDGPANDEGMPTEEFVAACLKGLERDIYMNAVGPAVRQYEQGEALFAAMNPR
jgi:uncharacterized oxidoreductase